MISRKWPGYDTYLNPHFIFTISPFLVIAVPHQTLLVVVPSVTQLQKQQKQTQQQQRTNEWLEKKNWGDASARIYLCCVEFIHLSSPSSDAREWQQPSLPTIKTFKHLHNANKLVQNNGICFRLSTVESLIRAAAVRCFNSTGDEDEVEDNS